MSLYSFRDVDTLERKPYKILRKGLFDVLIGVNLLREGLEAPEVSLVAILDADKEVFLKVIVPLTQNSGSCCSNVNGKAIMYADKIGFDAKTIDETNYRRKTNTLQYRKNNLQPKALNKSLNNALVAIRFRHYYEENFKSYRTRKPISKANNRKENSRLTKMMEKRQKLDFMQAAKFRR